MTFQRGSADIQAWECELSLEEGLEINSAYEGFHCAAFLGVFGSIKNKLENFTPMT
jgi:hypothetical protein